MAAGASAAFLPDNFSVEEALFALRQRLDDFSVAPDYATAAAISLLLDSAADNIAGWSLEDESHVYEVAMIAQMMLRQVYRFLTSPSCNQIAVDSLSLGLPNSVAKLGVVCWDFSAARDIIQRFASKCSPRDNVLILCEALDKHSSIRVVNSSSYFIILVDGIGKVLPLIQRHRAHNIKIAMRAVIGCVKYTIPVLDEHHGRNAIALFNAALVFSNTVQDMCKTTVDEEKEELTALLGLFALHNIPCISQSKQDHILSACGPLVIVYSQLAIPSDLSWLGLLTGDDIKLAIGKTDEGWVW
ncbi:aberrant root formation protein 4 isoform X1 [Brachypodium distachyon]|uniref:aberrant root formation protein 4 isoform X1 n=1 Tax=Brachypodium distachyon TaxID=15368 RepID=UPI00071E3534|nr:aberrant root formation protein 4 isoform X1 [Brachypodium distachyon]|eukprot:XP_014757714.1 aberrant root formation protein 4 isoform X1 [Brachypodium distachyon]